MREDQYGKAGPIIFIWRVRGRCPSHPGFNMHDYYDGLTIRGKPDGSYVLAGEMPDMPAVYGFLLILRDTGIDLLSLQVERISG